MPRAPRIVIIGGGIGGLAAALALERCGAEVVVCEQSPVHSEIGAGLNLTPNAVKAFRALGLDGAIEAIGWGSEWLMIRSWKSGRYISRIRRGEFRRKFGAPNVTVHRVDLLDVLRGALKTTDIRLGKRCIGVDGGDGGDGGGRAASARFADGSELEADIVVGADGIHSVVRESLFGADAPHFTGCICWRGMAPVDAVPADIDTADGTMWLGPHGHVVHYRVRRGELVNIVAHVDSDAWTEESWTRECGVAEVMAAYAAWHSALTRLYPCSSRWYKWALYDRDPLPRWSKGRATLLGRFRARHAALSRPRRRHGDRRRLAFWRQWWRGTATISARRWPPTSGCGRRAPRRPCSAPAPAPRRTISPRRGRGSSATSASRCASASAAATTTVFQTAWLYDYDVAREVG